MNRILFNHIGGCTSLWGIAGVILMLSSCQAQPTTGRTRVRTGAEILLGDSMALLQGKRVAVIANQTSRIGNTHLVDTLLSQGVDVVRIFAPEHGFRGTADAGEHVANGHDTRTKLPIVSLYGAHKTPSQAQLSDIDLVLFDIQDVGTRHYTYLATMCLAMERCAQLGKIFVVLDRPNPNGAYVEGPAMENAHTSFIGSHAGVPIVHGMTLGEYARMVAGEQWHTPDGPRQSNPPAVVYAQWQGLHIIPCEGYTHAMRWQETGLPWVAPSPNLASVNAAEWYPVLCWYEAAALSVGRGTDSAFEVVGAPWLTAEALQPLVAAGASAGVSTCHFTPRPLVGRAKNPPFLGEVCHGLHVASNATVTGEARFLLGLTHLRACMVVASEQKKPCLFDNFETWSGTARLRQQLDDGISPERCHASWHTGVAAFKAIRNKYLLYP